MTAPITSRGHDPDRVLPRADRAEGDRHEHHVERVAPRSAQGRARAAGPGKAQRGPGKHRQQRRSQHGVLRHELAKACLAASRDAGQPRDEQNQADHFGSAEGAAGAEKVQKRGDREQDEAKRQVHDRDDREHHAEGTDQAVLRVDAREHADADARRQACEQPWIHRDGASGKSHQRWRAVFPNCFGAIGALPGTSSSA